MLEGVEIKKLKVTVDDRGLLMEMLRRDDEIFEKFGQVYLSVCNPGIVKGWHYHKKQTDNFAVVKGNAKVVLYDMRPNSKTKLEIQEVFMGEKNPILLKIPPFVVHGVTSVDDGPVYIVNCPTLPYIYDKPDEYRIDFKSKEIPYDWDVDKGG